MSKQANTKIIGAFVVGAVALIIIGVMVFGSGKFFAHTRKYILFFEGSVKGLNVGAAVDFKGVKVGSVTEIRVLFDTTDLSLKIPVVIQLELNRVSEVYGDKESRKTVEQMGAGEILELLVQRGLRAQLKMQSLVTGQLYVDLDFYPDKPARYLKIDKNYPELPTVPSNLEELSKTFEKLPLEELANKLVLSIEGIEKFINSEELREILESTNHSMREAKHLLHNVNLQVKPLAAGVEKTLAETQKLLKNVDSQVKPISTGIQDTTKDARKVLANIDKNVAPLTDSLGETLQAARAAVEQANKTLSAIQDITGEDSSVRYEFTSTLKELAAASRSLRVLADYLERHPEALIRGKAKSEVK